MEQLAKFIMGQLMQHNAPITGDASISVAAYRTTVSSQVLNIGLSSVGQTGFKKRLLEESQVAIEASPQ